MYGLLGHLMLIVCFRGKSMWVGGYILLTVLLELTECSIRVLLITILLILEVKGV